MVQNALNAKNCNGNEKYAVVINGVCSAKK